MIWSGSAPRDVRVPVPLIGACDRPRLVRVRASNNFPRHDTLIPHRLYRSKNQAWLTPVEIFAPHYSIAVARSVNE